MYLAYAPAAGDMVASSLSMSAAALVRSGASGSGSSYRSNRRSAIAPPAGGLGFAAAAVAAPLAAAGPVGWIVLGAVAALPFIPKLFKIGHDPLKVAASQAVDTAEIELRRNLDEYRAGPRTAADQRAALDRFDQIWASVVSYCSDPQLGAAGAACIGDRDRGGRWPWPVYYRDPIAADMPSDAGAVNALLANPDVLLNDPGSYAWLLGAGLIAVGVLL